MRANTYQQFSHQAKGKDLGRECGHGRVPMATTCPPYHRLRGNTHRLFLKLIQEGGVHGEHWMRIRQEMAEFSEKPQVEFALHTKDWKKQTLLGVS